MNELQVLSWGNDLFESVPRLYRKQYIPNVEDIPGSCIEGELTDVGANQHFVLGQWFRSRYTNAALLTNGYNASEVYVRSTDIARTFKSAESFLLGLFPPTQECDVLLATKQQQQQRRNRRNQPATRLRDLPLGACLHSISSSQQQRQQGLRSPQSPILPLIPINTVVSARETLTPHANCPRLVSLCNAVQTTSEWAAREKAMSPLRQTLEARFNVSISNLHNDPPNLSWINLDENYQARLYYGEPEAISADEDAQVFRYVSWQMLQYYSQREAATLAVGDFLANTMNKNMNDTIYNTQSTLKFALFSAHDTSLGWMLNAFSQYNGTSWPLYAANIAFELVEDNAGFFYVRMLYNGEPLDLSKPVDPTYPPCTGFDAQLGCPWDSFQKLVSLITPDPTKTHDQLCAMNPAPAPIGGTSYLC